MSFTPVTLTPTAGFCVKSTTLEHGLLPPPAPTPSPNASTSPKPIGTSPGGLLEPAPQPIPVAKGMKVFVNICYDKNVPPPPDASEEVIQRAMKGTDETDDKDAEDEWYVPVVVSEPRTDKDKAGKMSLVVDCVYHSEVRKRTLRDPEFKVFLVELGLQRIEAQTGLTLSRHIGTPNIASKGTLQQRTVRIPTALLLKNAQNTAGAKEETAAERAVLGMARDSTTRPTVEALDAIVSGAKSDKGNAKEKQLETKKEFLMPLDVSWNWEKLEDSRIKVTIHIPDLTASSITSGDTFLDVEPRRIIVTYSSKTIDIDRTLSDAQLVLKIQERARMKASIISKAKLANFANPPANPREAEERKERIMAESDKEVARMLDLKRQREFDVDGAKAEWNIIDSMLTITL
ncbi:pre-RNA processing PIH1/Nop17-domain-containing protein [Ephemerocybe angulata]|uniref:Pre-RNA processing PIH1/Nop17-domain-containing protein n=1 Tax=Ephemerocybe angulata TaxID=980116 RepID=A0A8H6M3I9_9AGAR|nr:pre-RNA processing PIH1/Nop17-domain-containing protein [Tulosesus angulatus]